MRRTVDVREVEKLVAGGAQIVEVLPREAYEQQHLPGAVSIPLSELPSRAVELQQDRPVVVYCDDTQCDMSPRAAAQLVQFGFAEVYDFVGSKLAWLAAGLPTEGRQPERDRVGALTEDPPTCNIADDLATLQETLEVNGFCVVINDEQVVLGELGPEAIDLSGESLVADVMEPAPKTVRPSMPRPELVDLFRKEGLDHVLVTTLWGELLGVVYAADVAA